jgi:hypothetical protein
LNGLNLVSTKKNFTSKLLSVPTCVALYPELQTTSLMIAYRQHKTKFG